MSRRSAAREAKRSRRASLSDASKRVGKGHDPMAPLDQASESCYWCGERRSTRLKVGMLPGLGYGTYCMSCRNDGSGKE